MYLYKDTLKIIVCVCTSNEEIRCLKLCVLCLRYFRSRRGRSHKNQATRSPFLQNCSVYHDFPVFDGIVSVIENRTAGMSYRSNLHVIQKHNRLIEQSDFHDSLHGVDIQCTTANCVRGILESQKIKNKFQPAARLLTNLDQQLSLSPTHSTCHFEEVQQTILDILKHLRDLGVSCQQNQYKSKHDKGLTYSINIITNNFIY